MDRDKWHANCSCAFSLKNTRDVCLVLSWLKSDNSLFVFINPKAICTLSYNISCWMGMQCQYNEYISRSSHTLSFDQRIKTIQKLLTCWLKHTHRVWICSENAIYIKFWKSKKAKCYSSRLQTHWTLSEHKLWVDSTWETDLIWQTTTVPIHTCQ